MTILFGCAVMVFGGDVYAAVQPHPAVQALQDTLPDPAVFDALQRIAQEPVVVSVDQCSDEEMVNCYQQRNAQYADQMSRFLGVLTGLS